MGGPVGDGRRDRWGDRQPEVVPGDPAQQVEDLGGVVTDGVVEPAGQLARLTPGPVHPVDEPRGVEVFDPCVVVLQVERPQEPGALRRVADAHRRAAQPQGRDQGVEPARDDDLRPGEGGAHLGEGRERWHGHPAGRQVRAGPREHVGEFVGHLGVEEVATEQHQAEPVVEQPQEGRRQGVDVRLAQGRPGDRVAAPSVVGHHPDGDEPRFGCGVAGAGVGEGEVGSDDQGPVQSRRVQGLRRPAVADAHVGRQAGRRDEQAPGEGVGRRFRTDVEQHERAPAQATGQCQQREPRRKAPRPDPEGLLQDPHARDDDGVRRTGEAQAPGEVEQASGELACR